MRFDAVVFDFDGTLVDSAPAKYRAFFQIFPGDDAALTCVARVVHVDEPAEELEALRGHVGDARGALARAEVRRAPGDLDHLVEPRDRVEVLLRVEHRVEEAALPEGPGLSRPDEVGHALVERQPPELGVGDLQLVDGHRWLLLVRGGADGPGRDTSDRRSRVLLGQVSLTPRADAPTRRGTLAART